MAIQYTNTPHLAQNTSKTRRINLKIKISSISLITLLVVNLVTIILRWSTSSYQTIYNGNSFKSILNVVKFIDPILIILLVGIACFVKVIQQHGKVSRFVGIWLLAVTIILISAIVGAIHMKPGIYYAVQSWMFLMRPIFLFFVFHMFSIASQVYVKILRWLIFFLVVSSCVVIYQSYQPYVITSADYFTGLFEHSHAQAVTAYIAVFLLVGFPSTISSTKLRYLIVGLFLYTGYLAKNDKATSFLILIILFYLVGPYFRRLRRKIILVMSVFIISVTFVALTLSNGETSIRSRKVLAGNFEDLVEIRGGTNDLLKDVGIVQMMIFYTNQSLNDPIVALYGLGVGNFGSPSALAKFREHNGTEWQQKFFQWDVSPDLQNAYPRLGAISYNTSLLGVALGELGIIGFSGYIVLVLFPFMTKPRLLDDRRDQWSLLHLKAGYILILAISLIATSSSAAWENEIAITMMMAGFGSVSSSRL